MCDFQDGGVQLPGLFGYTSQYCLLDPIPAEQIAEMFIKSHVPVGLYTQDFHCVREGEREVVLVLVIAMAAAVWIGLRKGEVPLLLNPILQGQSRGRARSTGLHGFVEGALGFWSAWWNAAALDGRYL